MVSSAGWVLAAGGLVVANEAIFAPLVEHKTPWTSLNWRVVPATAVLALVIGGIEKVNGPFGKALGMLVFLSVMIVPYGNAKTPIDNIAKVIGA